MPWFVYIMSSTLSSNWLAECPICGKQYPVREIEAHANKCLIQSQIEEDERLAKKLGSSKVRINVL